MMRGRMTSERIDGDAAHVVDEREFEHPYKLTYAASAGAVDDETGEAAGAWIIWLPDGCLVVDGEAVDLTSGMTAANNYPAGWYDLTDVLDGLASGSTGFSLYLDVDSAKFKLSDAECSSPVLIASVSGLSSGRKDVLQVVRSSIVIGDGLHPWKLRLFDVSGTKHVGVWIPDVSAIVVARVKAENGANWLNSVDKVDAGGAMPGITVLEYGIGGVWADAGAPTADAQTGKVSTGVWGSWDISLGVISCQLHTGSYVLYGDISTFYIGSVVSDVCVNSLASRIFIQVSRLGGDASEDDFSDQGTGGGGGMFPWTASTRTIGTGGCMVGRRWYTCTNGTGSDKADGLYQLKVTLSANGAALEVVSGVSLGTSPSGTVSYIPIYQITNGKIADDYRGAFVVPCWE